MAYFKTFPLISYIYDEDSGIVRTEFSKKTVDLFRVESFEGIVGEGETTVFSYSGDVFIVEMETQSFSDLIDKVTDVKGVILNFNNN